MLNAMRTMLSCRMATSAGYHGLPVPSTMRAFFKRRPNGAVCAASEPGLAARLSASAEQQRRKRAPMEDVILEPHSWFANSSPCIIVRSERNCRQKCDSNEKDLDVVALPR